MTRIAVVDVGTNTTRLYLADVADGRITDELARRSIVTRLGAEVDSTRRLSNDALTREHRALADYHQQIIGAGPDRRVAIMTSAVRDADNGPEFAAVVERRYGLEVRILDGGEEARLTYRGATDELAGDDRTTTLVLDIGGGSTELVIGRGPVPEFHVSTQAGVVRHADRHIRSDPPTEAELDAVADDVRATLRAAIPEPRRRGVQRAIAVAGTPTSLAAIAQGLEPYDPARVHGYELSAATCGRIYARLQRLPLAARRRVPGLHPDRAIAILPGIVILREVMGLFELDAVTVSEHDILRGAALAYAR